MSEQIRVVVAGIERQVDAGTTAADLFADRREVIAARIGGELADLTRELRPGDVVEPVEI